MLFSALKWNIKSFLLHTSYVLSMLISKHWKTHKPLPPSEGGCQYPSYSLTSRWKKWHWHRKYRMHLLDRNHSCLRGYYYIIIKMIFIISSLHPGSCFSCRFSKFILFSSLNYDSISFLLHTAYVLSMSLENTGRFISKRRDKWQKIYFDF